MFKKKAQCTYLIDRNEVGVLIHELDRHLFEGALS